MTVKRFLYRPREAAKLLTICTKTLERMMKRGEIRFVIVGKRRKVLADDLDLLLKGEGICPSTGAARRASSTSTSNIVAFDFEAARTRRKGPPRSA